MKHIGGFFRYLLNINTIWGLMILVAFIACVSQQLAPKICTIAAGDLITGGENTLTISWKDKEGEWHDHATVLSYDGATLSAVAAAGEGPTVSVAGRNGPDFVLAWRLDEQGEYKVSLGEKQVSAGTLRNVQTFTDAALDYAETGFKIAFGLVAVMVLFLGLMKVGEDAGIVQMVARLFRPVIRYLFPQVPPDHPANGAILMNATTTILGLGNAATPFGLKAMKELQELNPHKEIASDSMVMLLGYNTAGFALLPTTLIAVRKAAGCSDPLEIIGTCMVAGAVSTVTAIVMVKVLGKLPFFTLEYAVREQAAEQAAAEPAAEKEEGG